MIADIQAVIEELGGKFESEKSMGRKTFVKPIRKRTAGTYWNLEFELDEDHCVDRNVFHRQIKSILLEFWCAGPTLSRVRNQTLMIKWMTAKLHDWGSHSGHSCLRRFPG